MAEIQNEYDALPGHFAQLKDTNRALREDTTPSTTESILFLGTATDGPVMQPVRVTPQNIGIFGKMVNANGTANGSTLVSKFEEAYQAGCRDIRLMRVTGKQAALSLKGTSFTQTTAEVKRDQLGVASGNVEVEFTLPHGGIDVSTVVVKANGVTLAGTDYVIDGGTYADDTDSANPVAEVKGELTLDANVADMKADVTISYTYKYLDANGEVKTSNVLENNTDATGKAMIANGQEVTFNLSEVPKAGLRLYADGQEIMDSSVYTIDAVNKKAVLKNTVKVKRDQLITANYSYDVTKTVTPTVELLSAFGGNLYNDLKAKVELTTGIVTVTIFKPESKKALMSEPPMTFKSTDYPSFQMMVNAINTHANNNSVVVASTRYNDIKTSTLEVKPETGFSGGDDEVFVTKEEMYQRLGGTKDEEGYVIKQGAFQLLENYSVDYVIPVGVYADDKLVGQYDNFAYQLALACAVMSHYNRLTLGVISTSSPAGTTLSEIEEHVRNMEVMPEAYYMRDRAGTEITNGDGERIDIGQYVSIIEGPDLLVGNTRLGVIATTGAASFTGMLSNLPLRSGAMNKIIPNALGLRYEYSSAQLNRLTKARLITFRMKNNGTGVSVVDAMTAAHAGSDYQRQSTIRIVKAAMEAIRTVADPYLGEPNDTTNRNALTAAIAKRLDLMKENKELLGYDFTIVATPQMELMGEARIELSLQAPNELRVLTTVVSLS